MKMVFVQNFLGPHFGIMYLSAILKEKGYNTDVFIEDLDKNIVQKITKSKPDIIGFTCITGEHQWVHRRILEIKKIMPDAIVVVGGPHPTYFPEMIQTSGIDVICRGDGEKSILELINRIKDKKPINDILGLWVKERGTIQRNAMASLVEDMDTLPFADRTIYDKYDFFKKETELPICVSRGCPYNCTFCYNAIKRDLYKGQKMVRIRSVDNIISEIKILLKKYPNTKSIIFNDDNFGIDLKWFDEFCEKYKMINGLPFFASIRADFINEERVKKLKNANCFCLSIGVESGDPELRKYILHKSITDEVCLNAAKIMRKYGIKIRTSNMVFLPEETIEKAFSTVILNKKMKVDFPWAYALQPYPGTDIYKYSVEKGFLDKNFSFDDIDPLGMLESPLAGKLKDGNKIKVLQRFFYFGVKVPGFIYLLKLLVHIPNNFIFDFFHKSSILISYAAYHQVGIVRALKIALQARKVENRK